MLNHIPGGICHAEPPDYGIRVPVIPQMVPQNRSPGPSVAINQYLLPQVVSCWSRELIKKCFLQKKKEMSVKEERQGGGTPLYSVLCLRSSSSVKMNVKGQPPKKVGGQKAKCLFAGQESTSNFI